MSQQPGPYFPQGQPSQQGQPQGYPPEHPSHGYPAQQNSGPPQGWAPQGQQPPAENPGWGQMYQGSPSQGGQPEAFKSAAPSTAGGENPRIGQMNGRLILFRPTNYNPMAKGFGSNPPGPQLTTEAIVLDGPPIEGVLDGKTGRLTPFTTGPRSTPFYVSAFYLTQQGLIQQLESAVPGRQFCLNRVEIKSIGQGKTWYQLNDMTREDEALARSIIGDQILTGWERIKADFARFTPQEPAPGDPWAGQQPQGQQNQAWGQPTAGQQGPPQGWGQPNQQQGPPAGWGGQQ